jgi:hypothetical protein
LVTNGRALPRLQPLKCRKWVGGGVVKPMVWSSILIRRSSPAAEASRVCSRFSNSVRLVGRPAMSTWLGYSRMNSCPSLLAWAPTTRSPTGWIPRSSLRPLMNSRTVAAVRIVVGGTRRATISFSRPVTPSVTGAKP